MAESTVTGGDAVVARLRNAPVAIRAELRIAIEKCAIELLTKAKEKLGGPVLKVKTGRLRRSINYKMSDASSGAVSATVGTNVVYAARHEFGFTGTESVRAHLRTIKQAWGKEIEPKLIKVKAHSRTANTPQKSFLRSSLEELRPSFVQRIEEAIAKAKI